MKYIATALLLFLLMDSNYCQENRHEISLGLNYPVHFAPNTIYREFGFELGYQYSREFKNKALIRTGLRMNIYYTLSWAKWTQIGFYMPVSVGYTWDKITLAGGIAGYMNPFMSFSQYEFSHWKDGIPPHDWEEYLNHRRIIGIGFNVNISFQITKRWLIFLDFLTLDDKSWPIFTTNYGILTFGYKFRF